MSLRKRLGESVDRWKRFTRPRSGDEDRKEIPPVEDPPEEVETTGGEVGEEVKTGRLLIPRPERAILEDSTPGGRRKARGAFGSPNGRKTARRQRI